MNLTSPTLDPLVSIVIVNWNGEKYLPRCLEAVEAQTFSDYEVIVVDNASSDRSVDGLETRWPGIQVLRLDENLGFAVANNLGARLARGRWLVLLNNDAFPNADWLEKLVQATQEHPQFAFFASRLIQANDPARLDGTGDVYHVSGLSWRRDYCRPVEQGHLEADEVFSPCAAAALYDRQAFLHVGGFDEAFINYHEDVDLGFRLRLQGQRCRYVPDAVAEHVGSASFGLESDRAIYYGHRNLVWSYFKNMPGSLVWRYLPAHLLANLVVIVYYTLRGKGKAIWRAKLDALRGLPVVLRTRKAIQEQRRISAKEIRSVMDRGWLSPYAPDKRAHKMRILARTIGLYHS